MFWTPFKPLLKSDVFLATRLPGLAPPHARSRFRSGSNLPPGEGAPRRPPTPCSGTRTQNKLRTEKELHFEETGNNELPDPSRKISLPSSERALLADRSKRILDIVVVLLQGDTSLRARKPAHRHCGPSQSRPFREIAHPKYTQSGSCGLTLTRSLGSLSAPLHPGQMRVGWGGGEVSALTA